MINERLIEYLAPHLPLTKAEIASLLEYPPNDELGDIALPCFALAKQLKQNPAQIAQKLADTIDHPLFRAEAVGPYLNFKLNRPSFGAELLERAQSEAFWRPDIGRGKRVVIDMSSPNIAKPFGIGHLRSTMIGNAIYRILGEVGFETVNVNHLGDWGTQFGKMIVAYLKWGDASAIRSSDNATKEYLSLYVKFHEEAERHPELEDEAREWFRKLEAGDSLATELWRDMIGESLKQFNKLYDRLDVAFDHVLGESFYNDKMGAVIKEVRSKGLLEESDGALVVRLDEYGMPPCLLVKSNGTSIYATRDLATAIYRREIMNGDLLLYVVGGEQSLHFQQVFRVLSKLDRSWEGRCQHIPFGLMMMEGQKMSTRRGKVLFLEDVLNEAVEQAKRIIEAKNPSLRDKEAAAEAIGIGAVVFGDLKNTRTLDVDFSLADVLNFEGETGPYLQYTYARMASILRKAAAGAAALHPADASLTGSGDRQSPATHKLHSTEASLTGSDQRQSPATSKLHPTEASLTGCDQRQSPATHKLHSTEASLTGCDQFQSAATLKLHPAESLLSDSDQRQSAATLNHAEPSASSVGGAADSRTLIDADFTLADNDHVWPLLKLIALYPARLSLAAERYEPSVLARYLLELAQLFNRFYHHVKVLDGSPAEQAFKLGVVRTASNVLRKGLTLLGLRPLEEL